MVSALAFVFKIIRPIIFSAVKKVNFPLSRNFSTIKGLFYSQGTIPQSRDFSTIKELLQKQGSFQ